MFVKFAFNWELYIGYANFIIYLTFSIEFMFIYILATMSKNVIHHDIFWDENDSYQNKLSLNNLGHTTLDKPTWN